MLVVGELPWYPTSMGKVTYYIVKHLLRKHEVFVTAPSAPSSTLSNLTPFSPKDFCNDPTLTPRERALCGEAAFGGRAWVVPWGRPEAVVKAVDPDVVLAYGTPYTPELGSFLTALRGRVPVAGYFISESLVLPPSYAGFALNATVFACPTEFARRTFVDGAGRRWPEARRALEERSYVVPHGIDLRVYRPESLKGVERVTEGPAYGMVAKNHFRKPVAAVVRAYARLVARGSKASLFLALVRFSGNSAWDVDAVVEEAEVEHGVDLRGRVTVLDSAQAESGVSEWRLMRVYASIDAHVFPSRGESFGLPPLEAAALGIPSVLSAHPALTEVWGGLPEEVFVPCQPFVTSEGLVLCEPLVDSLAEAMEYVMRERGVLGEAFREKAGEYGDGRMGDGILKLVEEAARIGAEPVGGGVGA